MKSSKRSRAIWSFLFFAMPTVCRANPECDSIETRKAVLEFMSSDSQNPLVAYAIKNSTVSGGARSDNSPSTNSTQSEVGKPFYELGQRMVMTSESKDKSTRKCSGAISVSIGDIKATKEEVDFTVQQSSAGKLSVSIEPFQF